MWAYIEKNIQEVADYSIVQLSEVANVSTATIVRTMKKKGYDGFTSFKHYLKEKKNTAVHLKDADKMDSKIQRAILKNEQEVIRTINMLDISIIDEAIQILKHSKKIVLFARGFSELIACEMQTKFQLLEKYCEMQTDPNIIKSLSRKLTKDTAVMFISLNGETPELVTAAKHCVENNVSTISILANPNSTLAQITEIVLCGFKSEISYFPDYEVRSRLPLSVIARILLDSYAIEGLETKT